MLPKSLVAVFIGSRLDNLADSDERKHMDRVSTGLNVLSVGVAIGFSACTGWFVPSYPSSFLANGWTVG